MIQKSLTNELRLARQHRDTLIDMRDQANLNVARESNRRLPEYAALCHAVALAEDEVKRVEGLASAFCPSADRKDGRACPA